MIYFDHAATTRVTPRVAEKMLHILEDEFGNPSSIHSLGFRAEKALREARKTLAKGVGARETELYFTGSGTEANNMVIQGMHRKLPLDQVFVTSACEHSSVYETMRAVERQGRKVYYLKPNPDGVIPLESLDSIQGEIGLASILYANNETGVLQKKELYQALRERAPKAFIHADMVQYFGKFPLKVRDFPVDAMSFSGHKIHGPKGVGVLYLRDGVSLPPLLYGGGQERGMRPGTENTPGIIALAEAFCQMEEERKDMEPLGAVLKEELADFPGVHFIGNQESKSPYIYCIAFEGIKAEVLIHMMEMEDMYLSSGSACSKMERSRVLVAMQVPEELLDCCVRISFQWENTPEEVRIFCQTLKEKVELIRKIKR